MAVPMAVLGGLAAAGAVGKMAGGYIEGQAAKDAARIQARAEREAMARQEQAYNELGPAYDPYIEQGTRAFDQLSGGVLSGEFDMPERGEFEYDQTAMDFLDPSMDYQRQVAQQALEESAAASGGLRSGATLAALQQQAQDYAMTDYGNAFNRMTNDKSTAYQMFNDNYNNAVARIQDRYGKLNNLSATGQNAQAGLQNLRLGHEANMGTGIRNVAGYQGDARLASGYQAANAFNALGTGASQFAGGALQGGYPTQSTPNVGTYTPNVGTYTPNVGTYTQNVGSNNPYNMTTQQQVPFRSMGFNPNMPKLSGGNA